jgi:hypothetical protein
VSTFAGQSGTRASKGYAEVRVPADRTPASGRFFGLTFEGRVEAEGPQRPGDVRLPARRANATDRGLNGPFSKRIEESLRVGPDETARQKAAHLD